jgi:cellulose synthase/poly-beta-1,6-N-acetylglucosamine synthase-like glycosyltransferase
MGDAVADKYEWACSLAKKAVTAEHNADYFYAAYLYGNGARVLGTLAGSSPEHKLSGILKKKSEELSGHAARLEALVQDLEDPSQRALPTPKVPELNEQVRTDTKVGSESGATMGTGLFNFLEGGSNEGADEATLNFRKGDKVKVLWKGRVGGWSRGEFNGKQGLFPSDYVAFSSDNSDDRFRGNWQPTVQNANAKSFLPPKAEEPLPPKKEWPEKKQSEEQAQQAQQAKFSMNASLNEDSAPAPAPAPEPEPLYQSSIIHESLPLPLPPSKQAEMAAKKSQKEESRAGEGADSVVEVEVAEELLMGPQYRPYLAAIRERGRQQDGEGEFAWEELHLCRYTPMQLGKGEATPALGAMGIGGYSMRPSVDAAASASRVRTMVCITVYNEGGDELRRTLEGIAQNLHTMSQRGMRGPAAWQEFLICIVIDGKNSASESMLDYASNSLGVYDAETMQIVGLGLGPVQMHLFELTTVMQLSGDGNSSPPQLQELPPLRLVFALKEKNAGKLDSHSWFFNAFVEYVYTKPTEGGSASGPLVASSNEYCDGVEYCVLLDVGTVPAPTAIFRLQRSLDRDPFMGGVCGEISPMNPDLLNPVVASQVFEYKVSNVLDRAMGSVFGFIDVLPGAFSAYRYRAIREEFPRGKGTGIGPDSTRAGPLKDYFSSITKDIEELGPFMANMNLAEDRILCFELLARPGCRWTLHYVKDAVACTDVPTSLTALLSQRRRWLNGSFFAALYALHAFFVECKVLGRTKHSCNEKVLLLLQFILQAVQMVVSWFMLANFYLAQAFVLQQFFAGGEGHAPALQSGHRYDASDYLLTGYIIVTLVQFVIALGNKPGDMKVAYKLSAIYYGLVLLLVLFIAVIQLVNGLGSSASAGGFNIAISRDDCGAFLAPSKCTSTDASGGGDCYAFLGGKGTGEFVCTPSVGGSCPWIGLDRLGTATPVLRTWKCGSNCAGSEGFIVLALMGSAGGIFVVAALHGELLVLLLCTLQYYVMLPTYVIIMVINSFANMHDLSWGTKGLTSAGGLLAKKDRAGSRGGKRHGHGEGAALSLALDMVREKARLKTQKKAEERERKQRLKTKFQTFRTSILVGWLLSNIVWALLVMELDPSGYCFLLVISAVILGINGMRMVSSVIFLMQRATRGVLYASGYTKPLPAAGTATAGTWQAEFPYPPPVFASRSTSTLNPYLEDSAEIDEASLRKLEAKFKTIHASSAVAGTSLYKVGSSQDMSAEQHDGYVPFEEGSGSGSSSRRFESNLEANWEHV